MVLSEAEAEQKLTALRRQRDALDRAITDLTLYLELGRRLTTTAEAPGDDFSRTILSDAVERAPQRPIHPAESVAHPGVRPFADTPMSPRDPVNPTASSGVSGATISASDAPDRRGSEAGAPGTLRQDVGESVLSEGVLARRYGRALIEAALSALDEAGRPLHASEILAMLTGRGFTLPGHDPVAALNTRLWKRSGPGGPLKRMGDAVYALAETEE